jgi:hypothetical protein
LPIARREVTAQVLAGAAQVQQRQAEAQQRRQAHLFAPGLGDRPAARMDQGRQPDQQKTADFPFWPILQRQRQQPVRVEIADAGHADTERAGDIAGLDPAIEARGAQAEFVLALDPPLDREQ